MSRPKQHPVLVALLVVSLLGVASAVFLPIGWWLNRFVVWLYYVGADAGVPRFVTLDWYDTALNMLLFAVPAMLAALAWPAVRRWIWVVAGLLISAVIEAVQWIALPRDASIFDLIANTIGAALGIFVVVMFGLLHHPDERRESDNQS